MNNVFLLLGGNLNDRFRLIELAKEKIKEEIGIIIHDSSLYETASWGFKAEQDFLNQVVLIETNLSPQKVLECCLKIENDLGRKRNFDQYESRTMDIDILFYNQEIINEEDLKIPHPKLHERRFTLEPLFEIAPEFIHPLLNKSITSLLNECEDESEVKKL